MHRNRYKNRARFRLYIFLFARIIYFVIRNVVVGMVCCFLSLGPSGKIDHVKDSTVRCDFIRRIVAEN